MRLFGSEDEKSKFFSSISGEIRKILEDYNITVYLQGSEEYYPSDEKTIFAYPGSILEEYKKILLPSEVPAKRVPLSFIFEGSTEYDNDFYYVPSVYRTIEFYDKNGSLVAFIDTKGNLHLTDFYHYSRPFPQLKEIFKYFLQDDGEIEERIFNEIKKIDSVKIVEIKTKFDKEKYIKKVKREIEKLKKLYENRITSLRKEFELSIELLQEKLKSAKQEGFMEGVKLLGKLKDWEVMSDRLVYKKTVYVERIKYENKLYEIPEEYQKKFYIKGLTVYITDKVYNEDTTYREKHHPNANGSVICLGTLEGKPLSEVLEKLPQLLETINLDSAYDIRETREAKEIIEKCKEVGGVWMV